jgi:hypothetical protein
MPASVYFINRGPGVEGSLREDSVTNAFWPIDKVALAALVDLGMSDLNIATYFHVSVDEIRALRQGYGVRQPVR